MIVKYSNRVAYKVEAIDRRLLLLQDRSRSHADDHRNLMFRIPEKEVEMKYESKREERLDHDEPEGPQLPHDDANKEDDVDMDAETQYDMFMGESVR